MDRALQEFLPVKGCIEKISLGKGIGWGLLGGLAGTAVMDLALMGALSAIGMSAFVCFSIVGDTVARFFSILGIEMASGVPMGIATHYLIGPVVGVIYGAIVTKVDTFRVGTIKKSVFLAILYVEILSQPILVTTPILLKMTKPETLQWFGGAFVMHLLLGIVLGVVVGYGFQIKQIVSSKK